MTDAPIGPVTTTAPPACPACTGPLPEDERFCEACGRRLHPVRGAAAADTAPPESLLRTEVVLDHVAAVSDRGHRRSRNEDAVAVSCGPSHPDASIAVVCDGVASTADAHLAARAAAAAAAGTLEATLAGGVCDDGAVSEALRSAFRAARDAVVTVSFDPDAGGLPPSTTLVAAVSLPGRVLVGSVGDSRAYWLPATGDGRLLTEDDTVAHELIAEGVDPEVARAGPDAHAITRWIGPDTESVDPTLSRVEVTGPGRVVLCSDGLWNYFEDAAALAELAATATDPSLLGMARAMVSGALGRGGADNVTVAVLDGRIRSGSSSAADDGPTAEH